MKKDPAVGNIGSRQVQRLRLSTFDDEDCGKYPSASSSSKKAAGTDNNEANKKVETSRGPPTPAAGTQLEKQTSPQQQFSSSSSAADPSSKTTIFFNHQNQTCALTTPNPSLMLFPAAAGDGGKVEKDNEDCRHFSTPQKGENDLLESTHFTEEERNPQKSATIEAFSSGNNQNSNRNANISAAISNPSSSTQDICVQQQQTQPNSNPSNDSHQQNCYQYRSLDHPMTQSQHSNNTTIGGEANGSGGGRNMRSQSQPCAQQQLVIHLPPITPSPTVIPTSSVDSAPSMDPTLSPCCLMAGGAGSDNGAASDASSPSLCVFGIILLGQIMSLCLAGTAISSQLLANNGFNAPTTQAIGNYFMLALFFGGTLLFRSGEDRNIGAVIKSRGVRYFFLALIDVEANYLIIKAYQYTNLTSIQLLDCFAIPTVMLLSWFFLSTKYYKIHYFGVAICLVGICIIIYGDATHGKGLEGGSNRLLGDILCLSASILYSICNVSEEFIVKSRDRAEYLGSVGIFAFLISAIQLSVFESRSLIEFQWSIQSIWMYILFTISMFVFYSIVSLVMQKSSALMFNLSVLSSDFYALMAGIFIFQYSFNYFYLASFFFVICGSSIYSLRKAPTGRDRRKKRDIEAITDRPADSNSKWGFCAIICKCCCPFFSIPSETEETTDELKKLPYSFKMVVGESSQSPPILFMSASEKIRLKEVIESTPKYMVP